MDFIRKAGGQKAKKLLAVILAAGMAMTALPGETITALAQEAEGQKNVLLAEEVSGSETDMPEEDTVSGNDGQAEDVIPGGDSRTAESISGNADSDVSGNADRQQDGIQGEIPAFPGYISMPGDEEADTVVYDSSAFLYIPCWNLSTSRQKVTCLLPETRILTVPVGHFLRFPWRKSV